MGVVTESGLKFKLHYFIDILILEKNITFEKSKCLSEESEVRNETFDFLSQHSFQILAAFYLNYDHLVAKKCKFAF